MKKYVQSLLYFSILLHWIQLCCLVFLKFALYADKHVCKQHSKRVHNYNLVHNKIKCTSTTTVVGTHISCPRIFFLTSGILRLATRLQVFLVLDEALILLLTGKLISGHSLLLQLCIFTIYVQHVMSQVRMALRLTKTLSLGT